MHNVFSEWIPGTTSNSPTGVPFESRVKRTAPGTLASLLIWMCLAAEMHDEGEIGVGIFDEVSQKRVNGGISLHKLQQLWDFWAKHTPVNPAMAADVLFNGYVISHELFAETKHFYLSQSFNVFGQLLFSASKDVISAS
jgi:hypothetical protein